MGSSHFRSVTGGHPPPGLHNHMIESRAQKDMQTRLETCLGGRTQKFEPFASSLLRNETRYIELPVFVEMMPSNMNQIKNLHFINKVS